PGSSGPCGAAPDGPGGGGHRPGRDRPDEPTGDHPAARRCAGPGPRVDLDRLRRQRRPGDPPGAARRLAHGPVRARRRGRPLRAADGAGFLLLGLLGTALADRGTTAALIALMLPTLLIGLGSGLGSGIVMTLSVDVSPVHGRTRYLACWTTMLGAGRLAAPLIITGITVFAPVTVAGAATGAVCVAGGLWLMRVLPRITPSGSTRGR